MQENRKLMINGTDVECVPLILAKGSHAPPLCDIEADLVYIVSYRLTRAM